MGVSKSDMLSEFRYLIACAKRRGGLGINQERVDAISSLISSSGKAVTSGFVVNSARAMHVEPKALLLFTKELGIEVADEKEKGDHHD
jgi:hypothetical protein